MTDTRNSDDNKISAEASAKVCSHMNDDHAVTVYAMAKKLLGSGHGKITDAKIKEVSLSGCVLAAVTCSGERCDMHRLNFPFQPPLNSTKELRPKMIEIHRDVCSPNPFWLITHLDALVVLVICSLLAYATHVIGPSQLAQTIESSEGWNSFISTIFGSADFFSQLVRYSWFLAIFLHSLEALYVAREAKSTLKLGPEGTMMWYVMISCTGYPITKEFLELLKAHKKSKSGKS